MSHCQREFALAPHFLRTEGALDALAKAKPLRFGQRVHHAVVNGKCGVNLRMSAFT
ncbi:MAG: hypothetical protein WC659_05925 [Patescibacteria group bacterium]